MVVRSPRLPGIRFEVQPPPPVQVLPRMDIGVFAGFAASGPLNVPVAVEDAAHFQGIFGDDLPLAWDELRGEMETAYLGPAVRAYFRGGGKRGYVIRVAGAAKTNLFPLAGLLRERTNGQLAPAYAAARSEGSWSDGLQAGMDTLSQPVGLLTLGINSAGQFEAGLTLARPGDLQTGDLLRFNFASGGEAYQLMFAPDAITLQPGGNTGAANCAVTWAGGRWFRAPGLPLGSPLGQARVFNSPSLNKVRSDWVDAWVPVGADWQSGSPVALALNLPPEQAPDPGSLIQGNFGGQTLWLVTLSTLVMHDPATDTDELQVVGMGLWESAAPPNWLDPALVRSGERLRMRLTARSAGGPAADRMVSGELGFAPGQANYWGGLPRDASLYTAQPPGMSNPYAGLWRAAAEPRFPLAGMRPPGDIYYPLPLPAAASLFTDPLRRPGTALERDGLADFSLDLFLDPLLKDSGVETLVAQADYLTYQTPSAHEPTGIYAALRLEEATLIAAPDVLHTGWTRDDTPAAQPEPVPPPREDSQCLLPESAGVFIDRNALGTPVLQVNTPLTPDAPYTVSWTPVSGPVTGYRLEEATRPDFSDAVTAANGLSLTYEIRGHGPGAYYYRARAEGSSGLPGSPRLIGAWSNSVGVRLGAVRPWKTRPAADFDEDALANFQRALLTLCAARGDLFALLGLPVFYHEDEALRFAGRMQQDTGQFIPGKLSIRTLSFGALYHPWLFAQDEAQTRPAQLIPPEGAVCGTIARRTLTRGAWLAAANEALAGVVAVQPRLAPVRYLDLQEGALNVIRQEARGFVVMSESTLATEPEFRPIHVRRLLMLLRRLALREGATYVFEPNSLVFRRQVQRGFEDILATLFLRGAFGGATAESSYQVDVSDRLNPPASVDEGRLIVEIRVAPSQPLMFLTVRLVLTGANGLLLQEGLS